jgi:hypothetical protein
MSEQKEEKVPEVIETYHSPFKKKTITVFDFDEDGKKIPIRDALTGVQIRIDKRPQYEESKVRFKNVISKASLGYDSIYVVDENTPRHIAETLAKMAADPGSDVKTEEAWIKMKNPDRYKEIERRKEFETKIKADYEAKIAAAKEEGLKEGAAGAEEATKELTVTKQELSNTKGALTKASNTMEKLNAQVKKLEESTKK